MNELYNLSNGSLETDPSLPPTLKRTSVSFRRFFFVKKLKAARREERGTMTYQTRYKIAQSKMEEAAQTLLKLSQSEDLPPHAPRLQRSLSHEDEAYARAIELAPRTKPGDTILMNFYIDSFQQATVKYMKNEKNIMVIHTISAPRDEIQIPWTYQVTDFPFY
jgi:hypothetical protein